MKYVIKEVKDINNEICDVKEFLYCQIKKEYGCKNVPPKIGCSAG